MFTVLMAIIVSLQDFKYIKDEHIYANGTEAKRLLKNWVFGMTNF